MDKIQEQILLNQSTIIGFLKNLHFAKDDSWLLNSRINETNKLLDETQSD